MILPSEQPYPFPLTGAVHRENPVFSGRNNEAGKAPKLKVQVTIFAWSEMGHFAWHFVTKPGTSITMKRQVLFCNGAALRNEAYQKAKSATQDLPCLSASIQLAQKVGAQLVGSALLQRCLPQQPTHCEKHCRKKQAMNYQTDTCC
jgi:hypothetical protein